MNSLAEKFYFSTPDQPGVFLRVPGLLGDFQS